MSALPRGLSLDVDGTLYTVGARVMFRLATTAGGWRSVTLLRRAREPLRGRAFGSADELRAELDRGLAALGNMSVQDATSLRLRVDANIMPEILRGAAAPGLSALLSRARERGVRLAAFSDHAGVAKLEGLGLRALFDVVVSAEDEGAYKPHPRGFIAVAERLGLPPGEVIHVGDREDTDVSGAMAAGMRAARVGKGTTAAGEGSAHGVVEILRRMLEG